MKQAAGQDQRLCHPVSTAELERRWKAVRSQMSRAGLDALLIEGAANFVGGGAYCRWFTGLAPSTTYPHTIVFPAAGLMTLVTHGPAGERTEFDGANPAFPGIGRKLSAPHFPAVGYSGQHEVAATARAIRDGGFKRVGLVGANAMYYGFLAGLREQLAEIHFVDADPIVDPIKAVKSAEEIAFIRQTATVQDQVLEKLRDHIKPGMKDFEVLAYAQYVGQLLGSATGYYLGSSAAPGTPAFIRSREEQGRALQKGDVMYWQAESSGPGGYFVHVGRIFVLGKAPPEIVDAFKTVVDAQRHTLDLLKPGISGRDLLEKYNAYMRARGLPEERRVHCHCQGYTTVERPIASESETMAFGPDMNIGIHPSIANGRLFATVCDNFLMRRDGSLERLHKLPQEIIEI
jgi:Xaa-Pro aminopeptidase